LQCEFSFYAKLFRVCCIYSPNRNPARDLFLHGLQSRIDPSIPTVLAGDFNAVFDRTLDRSGSDPSDLSHESSTSLLSLFDSCCVIDIWRYLHPTDAGFTWTRWNGAFASRIDLFGVPYVWVSSVSSCDIVPCPFSDHCGVFLSVSVRMLFPLLLASGSLIRPFLMMQNISKLSQMSGHHGVPPFTVSLLLPSGGRRVKV